MSKHGEHMRPTVEGPSALRVTTDQQKEALAAGAADGVQRKQRPSKASRASLGAVDVAAQTKGPRVLSPVSQRRHPGEADVGWAAGIMDGEGCILIARQTYGKSGRRPTYRLRLQITQNDETLLKEFEWSVGVEGRIYSPKPSRKQNKVCHSLNYDGVRAFTVLERLIAHLRRKKPQAELAAEFRAACDIHRHTGPKGCPEQVWDLRQWYYERMSDLKWS